MSGRHTRFIETGRAQLFTDVTVHDRPGEGNVELSGGAGGSVDGILIGGVTQLLVAAVPFNGTLAQTAIDVADAINLNVTAPNYHARAVGVFIYIWQQTIVAGPVTVVAATTTITTNDTDIDNGAIGNGTALGFTDEGFDMEVNDEFLEEPVEESGIRNVKVFSLSENLVITAVFKQWDSDVLELRYPGGRHSTGAVNSNVNRIEFGGLIPGTDMDPFFKVFELRPDNKAYPTLLIRRGLAIGNAGEPTRFRTQEVKKIGVSLKCYKDENHVATTYPTAGIDLAQNLVL
jgi:hypothetical protein